MLPLACLLEPLPNNSIKTQIHNTVNANVSSEAWLTIIALLQYVTLVLDKDSCLQRFCSNYTRQHCKQIGRIEHMSRPFYFSKGLE